MLHAAAASGSTQTVRLLIDMGADINDIDDVNLSILLILDIFERTLGWFHSASLGGYCQFPRYLATID